MSDAQLKRMKLGHLVKSLERDFREIMERAGLMPNDPRIDHGPHGLKFMYDLLHVTSCNRAYDDGHPRYRTGYWERYLPYDGRDYCFYYKDGANDTHVQTLLKELKRRIFGE